MKDVQSVVKKSYNGTITYKENPMPELVAEGLISQTGSGLFVIQGVLKRLLDKIETEFLKLARGLDAVEAEVPSILSWENALASKYLDSFQNQALVVHALKKTSETHSEYEGLSCPTVCYHLFGSLHGKKVTTEKTFTAIAKCTRKERGLLNDLSRLTNFTMREVVFVGTAEHCAKGMQRVLDETERVLQDVFDLNYEVRTASDPFFGENAEVKKMAQLLTESKIEVHALLPFKKETSSIASFNNHGTVFYQRFDITPTKSFNQSSCIGWGYERILFAILCQKGVDFSTRYYKELLQ